MKNNIPCSFFEWRNCVNRLNFAQSNFSGKNGGHSGPFAGGPFLQALQKKVENKTQATLIIWKLSYVTKPSQVSLQASSQWWIQTFREGGGGGGGGGGSSRPWDKVSPVSKKGGAGGRIPTPLP